MTEANYQRQIKLFGDRDGESELAHLYLGTSPGFQRVHASAADSPEVFSIKLSNYELGTSVDAWLDKALLALAEAPTEVTLALMADDEALGLSAGQQRLRKEDEGWTLQADTAAVVAADADAAQTYANRYTTLRVTGLADTQAQPAPLATVRLTDAGGVPIELQIERGAEDSYVVSSNQTPGRFTLPAYMAEQLLLSGTNLLPETEVETEPSAAEPASQ